MRIRIAALIAAFATLSACVSPAGRSDPPSPLTRSNLFYGSQVSTGPCVAGAEAVGLFATLAGAVIARGVDRLGTALQSAANKDVQTTLARRNVELSSGGFGPCVVVVRGWFFRENPFAGNNQFQPIESEFPMNDQDRIAALWRMGLWAASTPDFYFQGRLITNSSQNAYTVVPIHATLDQPISSHSLRSDRQGVVINFALAAGGASSIQSGGTTVVLGELAPGVLATFPLPQCVMGAGRTNQAAASCPAGPTPPPNVSRIIRPVFESEWFAPTLGNELKPMTLLAQVQETRDPSIFWGHVAAIFTAVQQPVTTRLQYALLPELGAGAAETELTASEGAQTAYDNAFSGAVTALDACIAAPADVAKRTAARVAIRNYIAAARRAEITARLSEQNITAITPMGPSATPCITARDALPS